MLYRNKKENDLNKNKFVGVGGHIENGETIDIALKREVKEETGLDLLSYEYRGIVYFSYDGYEETMHVFTSSDFKGIQIKCDEGDLIWVKKNKLFELNMWEGDYYFLKYLINDDNSFFRIKLEYEKDILVKYQYISDN